MAKANSKQAQAAAAAADIFGNAMADESAGEEEAVPLPAEGTRLRLPRAEIFPWELNPRRHYDEVELLDLGNDIKSRGQINDLIVRPYPGKSGFYQLIGGERRWRSTAPEIADVPQLWVRVFYPADDAAALDLAWADNAKRIDLTAMENAHYARLRRQMARDRGEADTLHAVGRAAGLSHERVRQIENLLDLPEFIIDEFDRLKLNEKHGRALLMLAPHPDEQRKLFRSIERGSLSGNAAIKSATDLRKQAEKEDEEAETPPPSAGSEASGAPTSSRSVQLEANAAPAGDSAQSGNSDDAELENADWRSDVPAQNAGGGSASGGVAASAPVSSGSGFSTVPEAGATDKPGPRKAPEVPGREVADQLREIGRYIASGAAIPARFDQEVDMAIAEIETAISQLKMARKTREGENN